MASPAEEGNPIAQIMDALDRIMQENGITDEWLRRYISFLDAFQLSFHDTIPGWVPVEERLMFEAIQQLATRTASAGVEREVLASDFMFADCQCGVTAVDLTQSRLHLVGWNGECNHLGIIVEVVRAWMPGGNRDIIEEMDLDPRLCHVLAKRGLLAVSANGYEATTFGTALVKLADRATNNWFARR